MVFSPVSDVHFIHFKRKGFELAAWNPKPDLPQVRPSDSQSLSIWNSSFERLHKYLLWWEKILLFSREVIFEKVFLFF